MLTLEDILEQIVGDISDEDDEDDQTEEIIKISDTAYKIGLPDKYSRRQ